MADSPLAATTMTLRDAGGDRPLTEHSDGVQALTVLALMGMGSATSARIVAIDEPETGLHPSMLPIIADFAVEASRRTQVIFTTHSDQFLDAFTETRPTTTVAKRENGETVLRVLDKEALDLWLGEYSLGTLYRSGELESGAVA